MMAQELRLAPPDAAAPLLLFAATAGAFLLASLAPLAAAHATSWGAPAASVQALLLRQFAAAAITAALVLAGLHTATLGTSQRASVVAAGAFRALGAVTAAGAAAAALGAALRGKLRGG